MADTDKYEDFNQEFFKYREFGPFKALSDADGLKRFSALCSMVDRAEQLLSICLPHDLSSFPGEIEDILLEHHKAVLQGDRKSAYIRTGSMDDGPGELASLKEAFEFDLEKNNANDNWDGFLLWGLWFATFALMKVAEAIEATDDQRAADAAIDAMDSIGYAEIIDMHWAAARMAESSANTKKELKGQALAALRLREADDESRRQRLSMAGKSGAQSLHRPVAELKAWALSEAKNSRGSHKDIARKLATQIPKHLADASKDPTRLIYDTLRAPTKRI